MESILESVKQYLGLGPESEVTAFDPDILMQINSAFATLEQIGIRTSEPFILTSNDQTWDDYYNLIESSGDDYKTNIGPLGLQHIKMYIFSTVRIAFDPPTSSFALEALKEIQKELTFRIQIMADRIKV